MRLRERQFAKIAEDQCAIIRRFEETNQKLKAVLPRFVAALKAATVHQADRP